MQAVLPAMKTADTSGEIESHTALAAADPDVQLMLRVKQGDAVAFNELCLRVRDRLVGKLYRWVEHRETAEDLAQETLLRVYSSRERYQPTARFVTYLYTIAANLAANELRRRGRKVARQFDDRAEAANELTQYADPRIPSPEQALEQRERTTVVQNAVGLLGPRQRSALCLRHYDGMSYHGIAAALATTPVGAKALLARARRSLAQRLRPVASHL